MFSSTAGFRILYVDCGLCAYAEGQSGTFSYHPIVDDIHRALMGYIHEQPCTWAPILSSVSDLVVTSA